MPFGLPLITGPPALAQIGAAPCGGTITTECSLPVPAASASNGTVSSLPWSAPAFLAVKGVLHQPDVKPTLKPDTRDAILLAIAKARSWIEALASGRVRSLAEIAQCERKVERHSDFSA
jgi:hypothetical protein